MFYRYFPFGINGILSGSAAVFFSYVGFDAVTSTAEEVKLKLTYFSVLFMMVNDTEGAKEIHGWVAAFYFVLSGSN